MQVFISFSGPRSHHVAKTLRSWLPSVIQSLKPWLSSKDLESGRTWSEEIKKKLKESKVGIICITASNQVKPWIQFEAGACASAVDGKYAMPYLIDVKSGDLVQPLASLQVREGFREDTLQLIEDINKLQDEPLAPEVLKGVFEKWWPDLEKELEAARKIEEGHTPDRTDEDKLDELLGLVRGLPGMLRPHSSRGWQESVRVKVRQRRASDWAEAVTALVDSRDVESAKGATFHVSPDATILIAAETWAAEYRETEWADQSPADAASEILSLAASASKTNILGRLGEVARESPDRPPQDPDGDASDGSPKKS